MGWVSESQMYALARLVNAIEQCFRSGLQRGPRPRHMVLSDLEKLAGAFRAMGDHVRDSGGPGNDVALSFVMGEFVHAVAPHLSDILEDRDQVRLLDFDPGQFDVPGYTQGMLASEALLKLWSELDQWLDAILPHWERGYVAHALPQDTAAAALFTAVDGKVAFAPFTSEIIEPDRATADAVRSALAARAGELADELFRSNCDRRVVEAFERMRNSLGSDGNPVLVDLAKMEFEAVSEAAADTIPDVLAAALRTHVKAISMMLAQYPEWSRFVQNADLAASLDNRATQVAEALDLVVVTLDGKSELAEPEVPRFFAYLRELVTSPRKALRRTLFAAINTASNLLKAIAANPVKSIALASLALELAVKLGALQPSASWIEIAKAILKNMVQ